MAVACRWVGFSKGKQAACQKCRKDLSVHMKQKILSHVCQYARQGIFKLLLDTKPFGNLVSDTFLSFCLAESEVK